MVIDKIGNVGKIFRNDKPQNSKNASQSKELASDTVSISKEALKAQEMAKASKVVNKSADIRQDKIKEIKEKLAKGEYDNIDSEMLDKVADKIAEALLRI